MAGIKEVNLRIYSPEEPRKAFVNTGHHWLGYINSIPAASVASNLPSVIQYLKDGKDQVDDEIKNYNTITNWNLAFFGSKKSLDELKTFQKDLDEVIKYLEEKQKKTTTP